jgi:hypothetical protein
MALILLKIKIVKIKNIKYFQKNIFIVIFVCEF